MVRIGLCYLGAECLNFDQGQDIISQGVVMDATATLVLISFLLFFAVIVYLMFQSSRKDKQRKQELAQTLGFMPVEI